MMNTWEVSENVISEFRTDNKNRRVTTISEEYMYIDPQMIIAINSDYEYPEILNDYKMKRLEESVISNGWLNNNIGDFSLLMLPNGHLVVNGNGNHRAVLSKEMKIKSVIANVIRIIYED
ncbi:hypothetical protein J1C67_14475 [Clostridium gasigenes]|uniref:hypothetical protein n=1 Tax=Clostridium gasigenes TaxID=94869 RepID=UPI0014385069|nr:hypothetical protein [Clostridium gasigenes]NKF05288.1 hypothetical protein [Clostridium gasigenes]QSW18743.1 hypothetical protein J1C67_14475 [Clostridium gasigenes]